MILRRLISAGALICAAAFVLAFAPRTLAQGAADDARLLFYGTGDAGSRDIPTVEGTRPVAPATANRRPGVQYWIELEGRGVVRSSWPFTTGDTIRIHARTNADGYLGVWTMALTGPPEILIGQAAAGRPAGYVTVGASQSSPTIRFQPPAEDENLLLRFSQQQLDLPSVAAKDSRSLSSGGVNSPNLIVTSEDQIAGQIGTYVVSRDGASIQHLIQLRHVSTPSLASALFARPRMPLRR